MSKRNQKTLDSNSILYGIRSDFKSKSTQWSTQYGWLRSDNKWYLVRYRTPTFWVRLFPFLMNLVTHDIWSIQEENLFNDKIFKVDESVVKQAKELDDATEKSSAFGLTIGIGLTGVATSTFYLLMSHVLPSNDHPNYLTGLFIVFITFFIGLSVAVLIWILTSKAIVKRMEINTQYKSVTTLLEEIKRYQRENKGLITFKLEINYNFVRAYFSKLLGIIVGFLFIMVAFIPSTSGVYDSALDSSAGKAMLGIILLNTTGIFIVGNYFAPFSRDQKKRGYLKIKNVNIMEVKNNDFSTE